MRVSAHRSPSDPDRPALPPGSRSAALSAASSWHGRRRLPPCPCDPDRGRGRAERRRRSGQHVAIQRIERGIVDVRREHAFAQIVEHHDAHAATQPAERLLMQFGPDARAGAEDQQAHGLCGCSRASSRTAACGGTCRCADRAPSGRCRNRPVLLRRAR